MKAVVLINAEGNQCEMYQTDGETLSRVWELLNNVHDQTPIKVPPTDATRLGASATKPVDWAGTPNPSPKPSGGSDFSKKPLPKGGKEITVKYSGYCAECGTKLEVGDRARYYPAGNGHKARLYGLTCHDRKDLDQAESYDAEKAAEAPESPASSDQAFAANLLSLMRAGG